MRPEEFDFVKFHQDLEILNEKILVFDSFIGSGTKVDGEIAWQIHSSLQSMAARIESCLNRMNQQEKREQARPITIKI